MAKVWAAVLWFYLGFCCCSRCEVGQPEHFCLSPTFLLLLRIVDTFTHLCHLWAVAQQWLGPMLTRMHILGYFWKFSAIPLGGGKAP